MSLVLECFIFLVLMLLNNFWTCKWIEIHNYWSFLFHVSNNCDFAKWSKCPGFIYVLLMEYIGSLRRPRLNGAYICFHTGLFWNSCNDQGIVRDSNSTSNARWTLNIEVLTRKFPSIFCLVLKHFVFCTLQDMYDNLSQNLEEVW